MPLIYSDTEKVDYIKHIVKINSEVNFIKELEKYIIKNKIKSEWMFSKLDESLDEIYIPYFSDSNNVYQKISLILLFG